MRALKFAGAFNRCRKSAQLVEAGKNHVDQLLRALIPLYIARGETFEVTSGDVSRFWAQHGVSLSGPAAAKALREHVGFSRRTKMGPQITPNGVKYVEHSLAL